MKSLIFIIAMLLSLTSWAEGFRAQATYPAVYKNECGSCHDPFPPGLLNKSDWGRVMQNLDRHYGTDASIDNAKTAATLASWLGQNAGHRADTGTNPPRFTATHWFKREHREVPPEGLKKLGINTPTYCTGCHLGAAQGRYGENEIRVPGQNRRNEDD
jgi:hypothetical protein